MHHVLESNDRGLDIDGAPRRYHAADYPEGAGVIHGGIMYYVRAVDGVLMFVSKGYELAA